MLLVSNCHSPDLHSLLPPLMTPLFTFNYQVHIDFIITQMHYGCARASWDGVLVASRERTEAVRTEELSLLEIYLFAKSRKTNFEKQNKQDQLHGP